MGGVIRNVTKVIAKPLQEVVKQVGEATGIIEEPKAAAPAAKPKEAVGAAAAAAEAAPSAAPTATPKAATAAGGGASAETPSARRRRGRGRVTGSRGVMGSAPVERKSLLGG